MNRKFPITGDLYESVYGSEFPIDKYFIILFDALPSKFGNKNLYDDKLYEKLTSNGFVVESNINISRKDYQRNVDSLLINREKQIIIKYTVTKYKEEKFAEIDIAYNILLGSLDSQLNMTELELYKKEKKKSNIQLVRSDMGRLDTEEYDLPIPEINLELNYGRNFMKVHETIVRRLNNDSDKGIILLHGDPGTGKCVLGSTKITVRNKITGVISEKNIEDLM
jgi:hypothetical protein